VEPMDVDDPSRPEFASWNSYDSFARRVRHTRRYVWTDREEAFLATVRATIRERDVELPEGMILYRAQRGIDWQMITDEDGKSLARSLFALVPNG
jgi:NMD protein affecting ribosome stability and mRNA decay